MKRVIIALTCLTITGLMFAHPASKLEAKADGLEKTLSIKYDHKVMSPKGHYIKNITVKFKGETIIKQKLTRQDTKKSGSVLYRIPSMSPGDEYNITAECSKSGTKKAAVKVGTVNFKKPVKPKKR